MKSETNLSWMTAPYWDAKIASGPGDGTAAEIFIAVGQSLSQWELLEITCGKLFSLFVMSKTDAASRAYGVLASSTSRAEALREAALSYFASEKTPPDYQEKFNKLSVAIARASARRNEIAHGIVIQYSSNKNGERIEHESGFFLVPPFYNSRKNVRLSEYFIDDPSIFNTIGVKYAYRSVDIKEYTEKFRDLCRRNLDLGRSIASLSKSRVS